MTSPPWVTNMNTAPWVSPATASQTVYPRLIWVYRLNTVAGTTDAIGNVGYSGAEVSSSPTEGQALILGGVNGLPAWVQLGSTGSRASRTQGILPGDAVVKPIWTIFVPGVAIYSIRDRDIIQDDEQYRYEVSANQWSAIGYQLSAIRLEA